jgi:hypothetical protein
MFAGLNSPPWRTTVIKQSGDSGDPSVVSMVNGILGDSLKLVKQHLELFGKFGPPTGSKATPRVE